MSSLILQQLKKHCVQRIQRWLLLHYLFYNRGREYHFVFNCALLLFIFNIDHKIIFCIQIIALFQYSLPYSKFSCSCCGHYIITLVCINTHLFYFYSFLYRVAINNHKGDSSSSSSGKLYLLLMFSLIFLLLVTKHYSTYTFFTAFVSKTVFYLTNSS